MLDAFTVDAHSGATVLTCLIFFTLLSHHSRTPRCDTVEKGSVSIISLVYAEIRVACNHTIFALTFQKLDENTLRDHFRAVIDKAWQLVVQGSIITIVNLELKCLKGTLGAYSMFALTRALESLFVFW